jgi:DNA methylase
VTVYLADPDVTLLHGDALDQLRTLPDESVHCCVTSPPFYGLRDYQVEGQIGLEETPEQWVENLVAVFREVRRVLRSDGQLWLEVGDSYATSPKGPNGDDKSGLTASGVRHQRIAGRVPPRPPTCKPKDLNADYLALSAKRLQQLRLEFA